MTDGKTRTNNGVVIHQFEYLESRNLTPKTGGHSGGGPQCTKNRRHSDRTAAHCSGAVFLGSLRGSETGKESFPPSILVCLYDFCCCSFSILSILQEIPKPCMPVSKQPLHDMHVAFAVSPLFQRLIKFGSRIKGRAREM